MKKLIPYCVLSAMALTAAVYAYIILDFSLLSWQALLALLFIAGPFAVYGWKQLARLGNKYPFACILCRFGMIVLAIVFVLIIVLKCVGVMK